MKYIVVKVGLGDNQREWPVIFPDNFIHSIMADAIKGYFAAEASSVRLPRPVITVVSAGSIEIDVRWCGGKSETLRLASADDDGQFIQCLPYNFGIRG